MNETKGTATYSPEDNKLRFYPDSRLSKEDYNRAREAGFKWAPKQELFVAPMWTPSREDLLLEWCGEIGDEDKSLVARAEERAERFADYSDKRKSDADQAHDAVNSICEHIPLGQPILVGHHSERRARKDAERIQSGMEKAVKMWEQSQYWKDRAASAVSHAKYKERPDVRARRIKTIEADKRKQERAKAEAEHLIRFWEGKLFAKNPTTGERRPIEITQENRDFLHQVLGRMSACGVSVRGIDGENWYSAWDCLAPDEERYKNCPTKTVAELQEIALRLQNQVIERCNRWIAHYDNRLAYERAMLEADGGTATDRKGPEKGGAVKCWASVRGCWSYIQKVNRVSVTVLDNWGNGGGNFTRNIPFDKCFSVMSAAEVQAAREAKRLVETSCKTGFGLLGDGNTAAKAAAPMAEVHNMQHAEAVAKAAENKAESAKFEALREQAKAGVQVVTAPNLFPTPPDLAKRMVELAFERGGWGVQVCAEMNERCRILEPSAGTGNIVRAIQEANKSPMAASCEVHAVEINPRLADGLRPLLGDDLRCGDFLSFNGELGKFDKIVMNPPFDHGSDIKHVEHAKAMLNPGGRLVAIVANGPRQREALEPLCTSWEDLPAGTFSESGTNVNTALIVIDN